MAEPAVLILSGPPGAGKSAVARELVKTADATAILIKGDTFWSFIAKGGVPPTKPQAQRKNLTVMQSMVAAARPFARQGYETIVDFSIGPWFLPAVQPFLKDVALDFVVLRPSKTVCARRAAERVEGRMPDYAPYSEFYDAFAAASDFESRTLSDDTATPAELAAQIRAGLRAGTFRISN